MQKKKAGLSYVEVIAAGALFMIILLGVLPLMLGAGRNLSYARDNQRFSLAANSLSLAVRDMVLSGASISNETVMAAANGFGVVNYSVFIFGPGGDSRFGSPFHSCDEAQGISLAGFQNLSGGRDSHLVYVVVMNDYHAVAGRAISVAISVNRASGIWRNARG